MHSVETWTRLLFLGNPQERKSFECFSFLNINSHFSMSIAYHMLDVNQKLFRGAVSITSPHFLFS